MESSIYLQRSDRDLHEFLIAALAVEVFMLLFFLECKVYDLSTAMFFAFSFGLLARGRFKEYYLLFPLACLNRETMFLMIIFFMVYFIKRLETRDWIGGMVYQGLVFVMIRIFVVWMFMENPGESFYFWPGSVMEGYVNEPALSLSLIALMGVASYFVGSHWREKPEFLRSAFVVLFPLQLGLHLLFGASFELRVFAEVWPVVAVMVSGR